MTSPRTDPARDDVDQADPGRRPAWLWIGIVALVVVAAVIVIAVLNQGRPAPAPSGSTTPGASSTAESSASPQPSATATPSDSSPATPAAPLPFDGDGSLGAGLTTRLANIESVAGEASQPGEVAGPSVRFTVEVTNTGADSVSLESVAVVAYYGPDRTPALSLSAPGAAPFPQAVAAGETVRGVYVFSVPTDSRDDVSLTIDLASEGAQTVFQGAAPR